MRHLGLLFLLTAPLLLQADPTDEVNMIIGVGRGGSTVIGPTLPNGSIHPSPDTAEGGQAGYRQDRPIRGFSQLHASGTGWGRYGNLMFSPQVGPAPDVSPEGHDSQRAGENYDITQYSVRLQKYNVLVNLTPTRHAAIYKFTYPAGDQSQLTLDLGAQIPGQIGTQKGDGLVDNSVIEIDPKTGSFSGSSHYYGGFGGGRYTLYFYGEIDQAPTAVGTWNKTEISPDATKKWLNAGDRIGGWWRFTTDGKKPVIMKIAVSFKSIDKAKEFLQTEIPDWDWEKVRLAAKKTWNDFLSRVAITGGDKSQRTKFYTALYHSAIMPRDRTGEFNQYAADVPMWDDFYATWDVWRTVYPLMMFIQPEMVRGSINSFIERLRVDGQVRDTFTSGCGGDPAKFNPTGWNPNQDQGGNDPDNIIADAYVKGLTGVDWEKAYAILKHDAEKERQGNFTEGAADFRKQGWIRPGKMNISNTLEYAYNDFCTAEVAEGLGKKDDAAYYRARARQWQNLFNPAVESDGYKGFMAPKNLDGTWIDIDVKKYPGSWGSYFYEGSSWTYSYFAPHQAARLVTLMGGPETFAKRLDYGNANKLINYSNEPAFLAPVLFHYAGRPDLSAKWMRSFANLYTDFDVPGNDDSGAMSSYYILITMGLIPNAGQDIYYFTGPLVEKIVVTRPEDKPLTITRSGEGDYIASVTLNGKPFTRSWIRHGELKGETTLAFTMSPVATDWGTKEVPPSDAAEAGILPPPPVGP